MVVCQQCNIVADTVPRELNAILQVKPASDRHLRERDGGLQWLILTSVHPKAAHLGKTRQKKYIYI